MSGHETDHCGPRRSCGGQDPGLGPACQQNSDECVDPSQQCDIGVCPESTQPVGRCPESAEDSRLGLEAQVTAGPFQVLPRIEGGDPTAEVAGEACAGSELSC